MKDIQILGWFWYNHTPEMFAYCMVDINREWSGYVAGKQRLFADNPLIFLGSLSDDNLKRFVVRMVALHDDHPSIVEAHKYTESTIKVYGVTI